MLSNIIEWNSKQEWNVNKRMQNISKKIKIVHSLINAIDDCISEWENWLKLSVTWRSCCCSLSLIRNINRNSIRFVEPNYVKVKKSIEFVDIYCKLRKMLHMCNSLTRVVFLLCFALLRSLEVNIWKPVNISVIIVDFIISCFLSLWLHIKCYKINIFTSKSLIHLIRLNNVGEKSHLLCN